MRLSSFVSAFIACLILLLVITSSGVAFGDALSTILILFFILAPFLSHLIYEFLFKRRISNSTGRILISSIGSLILVAFFIFVLRLVISFIWLERELPSLSPSTSSKLTEVFESLPKGMVAFSCPLEMTVGITESCKARIANEKYLLNFFRTALIKGMEGRIELIELRYVSSEMNIKLTGRTFNIYPQEDGGNQPIIDVDFTTWQWDVTPEKQGIQKLKFIVSVILSVPGYKQLPPKRYEEEVIEVSVKVNPAYSIESFVEKQWRYIVTIFFASLFLVVFLFVFAKRRQSIMVNKGDTYNVRQAGAVGKYARSDGNTFVQSDQEVSLAEAAAEIQQLLDQLARTYPAAQESIITHAIQKEIKRNPSLKNRLISALKAGGVEALKAIFNHPLVNVPIEVVKGFLETEPE